MRIGFYLMALLLASCHVAPAFATDAAMCYVIGDADGRAFCLAKARRDVSMCYAIQASTLRAQCLAEVRN